jgi:hypothetical protein
MLATILIVITDELALLIYARSSRPHLTGMRRESLIGILAESKPVHNAESPPKSLEIDARVESLCLSLQAAA